MTRHKCYYFNCKNTSAKKSLFTFPWNDPERLKIWIENCGNMTIAQLPTHCLRSRYLCVDHFKKEDIQNESGQRKRLDKTAVPKRSKNCKTVGLSSIASSSDPARVLRKTAVPSVFKWDKSSTQDQLPEVLPPDHYLSLTVGKPSSSTQDTPSFNPNRVKATYSRGKSSNPNAVSAVSAPAPVPIQNPEPTQIQNAKNTNQLMEYKPKKYMTAHVDYDKIEDLTVTRFLCPGSVNNYEKRLKISSKPQNNSKTKGGPKLTPCLPPIVNINTYQEVGKLSTADILSNNNQFVENESMFTSFLPLEVNIKTELEDETVSSDFNFTNTDENMLSSLSLPPEVIINPCLPPEVIIKKEMEDQPVNMIEVEIDMQTIKQEISDEITDNHL